MKLAISRNFMYVQHLRVVLKPLIGPVSATHTREDTSLATLIEAPQFDPLCFLLLYPRRLIHVGPVSGNNTVRIDVHKNL